MKRPLWWVGALGALIVGCSEGGLPLEAGNGRTVDYAAAAANAPTSFPWSSLGAA